MRARLQHQDGEDLGNDLVVLLERVPEAVVHGTVQLEELVHRRLARRSARAVAEQAIGQRDHLPQGTPLPIGGQVVAEGEDALRMRILVFVLALRQPAELADRVLERGEVPWLREVQLPARHVPLDVVAARHRDGDLEVSRAQRPRRDALESGERARPLPTDARLVRRRG